MTKQKDTSRGKNPKLESTKVKSAPAPIRARCTNDKVDGIRQKALKSGASKVTTMLVGPNQSETAAEFTKKADAKKFSEWLQSSRNIELV